MHRFKNQQNALRRLSGRSLPTTAAATAAVIRGKSSHAGGWLQLMLLAISLTTLPANAMTRLDDQQLEQVAGQGIAFALDNFSLRTAPTTFIEQVGGAPGSDTTLERGDLRWFGASISGFSSAETAGDLFTWSGGCNSGLNALGCPISSNGIENYANHDNPFVLRVFDYTRVGLDGSGDWVGNPVDPDSGISDGGITRTVLELVGPSNSDNFRWAFWGEIQASETDASGAITNVLGLLQNQNLIIGKPAAYRRPVSVFGTNPANNSVEGSLLQLFENQEDGSLGILYHSRLSGDYRFSINQLGPDADGVPQFTSEEGLYFGNVNAYLPFGQLHYQSILLDDTNPGSTGGVGDGNFTITLNRIPNDSNVINDFYSAAGPTGYERENRNDRYYQTHGFVEWGSDFPTCAGANCLSGSGVSNVRFAGTGGSSREQVVADGIAFATASAASTFQLNTNQNDPGSPTVNVNAVNLGSARVEGLLVHHLKITTLGAGN